MRELVIATTNLGKLREIKELLKDFDFKILSLADFPEAPEVVEDGKSFTENALKKAKVIAQFTGLLTMGEDSGIEISALDNRPGIYSARFSGEGATDLKNNQKMIEELKGVPTEKRQARYRCFAALVDGSQDCKEIAVVDGCCEGIITDEPRGNNGFGYDPYFLIEEYGKTFGELPSEVKSKISHRAKALEKIRSVLKKYLEAD